MVMFTLELVMEELQGWRPRSRCALALRLGEEPLTLLEGGQGEDVRGQGKALVFDLPEVLLEQTLPLWIMLLMLPDLMVRSADLVASCCLDLRHEVAAALEGEGAPMFRRCHYGTEHGSTTGLERRTSERSADRSGDPTSPRIGRSVVAGRSRSHR
ncbi:unnamed protein product [Durusdinium trenchii]|uniref:Uncharacterized protein n=1 Tax=Durusdinium trenchii TaxID=1381693 RepID=A0ABP0S4L6_9DINO